MNPVEISESLKDVLLSYLTTTFDVNRYGEEPALAQEIRRQFSQDGALVKGPYLESAPPYLTGASLRELKQEGVVSDDLLALSSFRQGRPIPLDAPLYTHQERAIRKLIQEERSIVVASGTGSGKSESFLLPILDDLLRRPRKGVCAVLIYPLNALVNDQLDRLRTLLSGTSITFGRYTSELESEDAVARRKSSIRHPENEILGRDVIRSRQKLPNILITNYAMLEYLLLRPQDTPLFEHQDDWRYIVLDEAHSYSGAQGIEVAMLIRRLKQRLGKRPGDMLCVATSATLSDKVETAASFASTLFGEDITPDDIIMGEADDELPADFEGGLQPAPESYLSASINELVRDLSDETSATSVTQALQSNGLSDSSVPLAEGTGFQALYDTMRRNEHLKNLRLMLQRDSAQPITLSGIARELLPSLHPEDGVLAASRLIELGATARTSADGAPLLPARYHMFARAPQGVWLCVNPQCPDRKHESTGWSRVFTVKRETCDLCGCKVFPLVVCRECGQALLTNKENEFDTEQEQIVFHWRRFEADPSLGDAESDGLSTTEEIETPRGLFELQPFPICLTCGLQADDCTCPHRANSAEFHIVHKQEKSGSRTKLTLLRELNQCPRCFSKRPGNTEVMTRVNVGSGTPLTILTQELYRLLSPSADLIVRKQPGEGRKLLTFYDSRQGAARFAAMLQDSVNDSSYMNIVAAATEQLTTEQDYFPDFGALRDRVTSLVIDTRLYHNDSELFELNKNFWRKSDELNRNDQEAMKKYVSARLLAELTTNRNRRGALERLGIITVRYTEIDNPNLWRGLAERIGLPTDVTQGLVEALLDRLRTYKIVTFPTGVEAKDPLFGRNQTHKSVVLSNGDGLREAWIGKTANHGHNRLVERILQRYRPAKQADARTILQTIWEWLCDETPLLVQVSGSAAERRINHNQLFFGRGDLLYICTRCQSMSTRYTGVCQTRSCPGHQQPADAHDALSDNFYFRSSKRLPIPMRVEEHTAQLDPSKGREYQEAFKAGKINLLSCSTTFEMGIDLGDLNAVVMNNVPPLVANYRQRSGRAGRRANGTAFILTWANDRPHDQHYFRNPTDIIRGPVRTPHIQLHNPAIRQRHINSLLLGEFLRSLADKGYGSLLQSGQFLDRSGAVETPYIDLLRPWADATYPALEALLTRFSQHWLGIEQSPAGWLDLFLQDIESAAQRFNDSAAYYTTQRDKAHQNAASGATRAERDDALHAFRHMDYLLDRLLKEDLTEFLPKRGVLPSYSFPLYSVELLLPAEHAEKKELRLERDLRQAIREFAPESEIVADKRIWKSGGVAFYRQGVRGRYYRVCKICRNLELGVDDGIELSNESGTCSVCKQPLSGPQQFVTPDAFRADKKGSGSVARQIVNTLSATMQGAMVIPNTDVSEEEIGSFVRLSSQTQGDLLYVNQGSGGREFRICLTCGYPRHKGQCPICQDNGFIRKVSLGHTRPTSILRLRFVDTDDYVIPPPDQSSFWLSLMYALIHGASRGLQIERRDLNGLLAPRGLEDGSWVQTIVLYDDVAGGAGHTDQIRKNIKIVLREALRVAECTDCSEETSCYHCLRDYSNQNEHGQLARGPVVAFLRRILDDISDGADLPAGVSRVIAGDLRTWLFRRIARAHVSVDLALNAVLPSDRAPLSELIHDLLRRNVRTSLYLHTLPGIKPEELPVRKSLQGLMVDSLQLYQIGSMPTWNVLIDCSDEGRAETFRFSSQDLINDLHEIYELVRSEHPAIITEAVADLASQRPKLVNPKLLDMPADTRLIEINESTTRTTNEEALFGHLFAEPVVELIVNDRYLNSRDKVVNRLGAYVRMAAKSGRLTSVKVFTSKSDERNGNTWTTQKAAEAELEREFPGIISFRHNSTEHDRSVRLVHESGSETLLVLGRGLDFIGPDGRVRNTFVTVRRVDK